MAFYTKYRPQVFADIDNLYVQGELFQLLNKPKKELPHAFLFTGPKGAGKTTAARLVAKFLNCIKPTKKGPCGKCEQCASIANGTNLDVLEMDAASNRGIDEIRQLKEGISLTPLRGEYKIYIVDEVHMLTTEAFNALLKTLEEPPPHAVFVLATTEIHKIPSTIKSRCIGIEFKRAGKKELMHALTRIVSEEKIKIDSEALELIANNADGSFRDAVKNLEQVSFHKGKITSDVIRDLLAVSEEQTLTKFLLALGKKDRKAALALIGDLVRNGRDIKTFLVDILRTLEVMLVDSAMGKPIDLLREGDVRDLIQRFTNAYGQLRISPIPELPLELAVVEFCGEKAVLPDSVSSGGSLTLEQLTGHWPDFIAAIKPFNHSIAGVLRSARPKAVKNGIVTIEAFYKFHQEKLSEPKVTELLVSLFKKLFGEKLNVEVVLGKKYYDKSI